MLHISPSLSLAKFLWSKPLEPSSAPITLQTNGEMKQSVIKIEADYVDRVKGNFSSNGVILMSHFADDNKNSSEEENSTTKIAGLRAFWSHQMKATEKKWKQYLEQISVDQNQQPAIDYDTEIGEVDWGAVRERISWRWWLSQQNQDNMSNDEWQELQGMSAKLPPLFIYKICSPYSKMVYDPESRPIFQEFDFF